MKKFSLLALALGLMLVGCGDDASKTTLGTGVAQLAAPAEFTVLVKITRNTSTTPPQIVNILKWRQVPYATSYDIYRSFDGGVTKQFVYEATGQMTLWQDTTNGVDPKTGAAMNAATTFTYQKDVVWYYYINARVDNSETTNGNYQGTPTLIDSEFNTAAADIRLSAMDSDIPKITNLTASQGTYASQVTLTWTKVSDPVDCATPVTYKVYRTEYNYCGYTSIGAVELTGTVIDRTDGLHAEFVDTTATAGTGSWHTDKYYTYQVKAFNGAKESLLSNVSTGWTTITFDYNNAIRNVAAVSDESQNPTNRDLIIEWSKVGSEAVDVTPAQPLLYTAATSYEIWRNEISSASKSSGFTRIATLTSPFTPGSTGSNMYRYVDASDKKYGFQYRYMVRALATVDGSVIESDFMNSGVFATGNINGMPTTSPTLVQGNTANMQTVTWTDITGHITPALLDDVAVTTYDVRYAVEATYQAQADKSNVATSIANSVRVVSDNTNPALEETVELPWNVANYTALAANTYRLVIIVTGYNGQQSVSWAGTTFVKP